MYTEFIAASLEAQGHIEEERVAEAFDRLDSDDSGYISKENLAEFLGKEKHSPEIAAIIKDIDGDGDGQSKNTLITVCVTLFLCFFFSFVACPSCFVFGTQFHMQSSLNCFKKRCTHSFSRMTVLMKLRQLGLLKMV